MSTSTTPKQLFLVAWPFIASNSAAMISYSMRETRFSIRWITGFCVLKSIQYIQIYSNAEWMKILPSLLTDAKKAYYWIIINSTISLIATTAGTGFFGGTKYYKKHGIDSYKKALISSLCPGQVYFKKNKNARYKALKNLAKLSCSVGIGYGISLFLKSHPFIMEKIENNVILHMEVLGFLFSITHSIQNVFADLHYLIFGGNDDIEVIPPYDFVFFSKSIRIFWKNWSRPLGELLRYAIYEPLGGRKKYWLSVPALFAFNCSLHFDFSMNIYGYKAMNEWTKAFVIMGTSISVQMMMENIFLKHKYDDKYVNVKDNIYWKIWCFVLFNSSMAATLYVIHNKAVICNLKNIGNTLLGKQVFQT